MIDRSVQSEMFDLLATGIQQRNMLADRMFYEVGGLTRAELLQFSGPVYPEGGIIVERSTGTNGNRVRKFSTCESFRAEPGELLWHFTVVGIVSSDVGAPALARKLANYVDAPVIAVVAGYGMSDLLSEAMGGFLPYL